MNPAQIHSVTQKNGMPLSDRQARMAEMIRQDNVIHVEALARHFKVSAQTIRRDLRVLCSQGFAMRIHGGAKCPDPAANLAARWRGIPNEAVKQAIAEKVARQIPNGVSVALGAGTTPEMVARALMAHEDLKIFTCSLNIALLAAAVSEMQTKMCWDPAWKPFSGPIKWISASAVRQGWMMTAPFWIFLKKRSGCVKSSGKTAAVSTWCWTRPSSVVPPMCGAEG